jgi:hypothetical protein
MENYLWKNVARIKELTARLAAVDIVARLAPEEPDTLAIAFADIEESMRTFLETQLPRLTDSTVRGDALKDLLFDISEEFRHIAYHFHDPYFFRSIEPTHDWLTVEDYSKPRQI